MLEGEPLTVCTNVSVNNKHRHTHVHAQNTSHALFCAQSHNNHFKVTHIHQPFPSYFNDGTSFIWKEAPQIFVRQRETVIEQAWTPLCAGFFCSAGFCCCLFCCWSFKFAQKYLNINLFNMILQITPHIHLFG